MAELTKDDIKEAMGFIEGFQKIFGNLGNAASAIAVLGQLKSSADSLTAKGEKLRGEVAVLEGQKAKFAEEREAQKKTLEAQRVSVLQSIEKDASDVRMRAAMKEGEFGLKFAEEIAALEEEKAELKQAIYDLTREKDNLIGWIEALKGLQAQEQVKLASIRSDIAELKSRL